MIGIITMPHRMADPHSVVPPTWLLGPDGGILGDRIDDWISSAELRLTSQMELNGLDFASSCGLNPKDEVVVCAAWRCTTTHLRGSCRAKPFRLDRCEESIPLELVVPPGSLEGGLVVRTTISLICRVDAKPDPTVAKRPGSILWHDHPTGRTVALGSPKFPVAAIDFAATGFGDVGSSWRLVLDASDLAAPLEGAVRLLINSRNERLMAAVTEGWRDSGAAVIRSLLGFAVQRELVHAALDRINDLCAIDPEQGSVGAALKGILLERFPDVDSREIRKERDRDLQTFETHLQARLGLLQIGELP